MVRGEEKRMGSEERGARAGSCNLVILFVMNHRPELILSYFQFVSLDRYCSTTSHVD